jgi:hypothetical protein
VLNAGSETICNNTVPAPVTFSLNPSLSPIRWYYRNDSTGSPSPTDPLTGWTLIPGASSNSYTPPAGITGVRTYAARVGNGSAARWAEGVRVINTLPPFDPGTITLGDESFCNSGNPSNITLSELPQGSGGYQWRWYFRESPLGDCPVGNSIPSGWSTNNTSVNISGTTFTGEGMNFDPSSAGQLVNGGRTFAVLITPIASGNIPACGTAQWAEGCRKTTLVSCESSTAGILNSGSETLCHTSSPVPITFSLNPSFGPVRWYYRSESTVAPLATDPVTGWTLIQGASGNSYSLPAGLTGVRAYAARVGNGANARWAQGVRVVTTLPPFSPGAITIGNESFCNNGNPSNITLSELPQGSGGYHWRWYYRENAMGNCPQGGAITSEWLTNNSSPNITGTTNDGAGIQFDPINAGQIANGGRTFSVFITPTSNGLVPACGTAQWVNNCRKTFVNPCRFDQSDQEDTIEVRDLDDEVTFDIYPIPNDGRFTARIESEETLGLCSVEVYDFSGRLISNQVITHQSGESIIHFDLPVTVNGLYLLKFSNKDGLQIIKRIPVVRQ